MRLHVFSTAAAALALAGSVLSQDQAAFDRVSLRVTATGPGRRVTVDRGERDRVAPGDLVVFFPRAGSTYRGTVYQVDDRSAVVELIDPNQIPPVGTRGEVLVPKRRGGQEQPPPDRPPDRPPDQPPDAPPERDPQDPEWRNKDEGFDPSMPLLEMRSVRPNERAMRLSGRAWMSGDVVYNTIEDFDNSLFRTGGELFLDNPFDLGGSLRFDGEFNVKTEVNDQRGADLLVRQLSYVFGGTRFSSSRWELGRFIHHDMPEFGILDGFQWSERTEGGDRFGGSIGFLPELDDDFESLEDFQLMGYYIWSADDRELFTIGGGYQKSWHNGKTDRDLVILKSDFIPADDWNLYSRFWIDFYYGRDDIKGSGPELTQALVSLNRRWESGNGMDLTWRRIRFPEMLRDEFLPVLDAELANNRYDRLGFTWWLGGDPRWHGQLAGWTDEDEEGGGSVELGLDVPDFVFDGRADIVAFGTLSEFTNLIGGRITWWIPTDNGRWDVFYELANQHLSGFANSADDMLQHRLGIGRSIYTDSGWSLDFRCEGHLFDEEFALIAGFYVQRTF